MLQGRLRWRVLQRVIAMAVTAFLTANGVNAWWLLVIGVFAPLTCSVFRAAR